MPRSHKATASMRSSAASYGRDRDFRVDFPRRTGPLDISLHWLTWDYVHARRIGAQLVTIQAQNELIAELGRTITAQANTIELLVQEKP